ncbi:MAG: type II CRISPR-associated endonuclease Cas1 [Bacilli bacterium]|nr:type II CRISPR-associated endonuclease Cas1 [Bacilli bacterium]MDD4411680.1 type II CRISPR-associated endonuclease Cas1 [Bacilli bacterium]
MSFRTVVIQKQSKLSYKNDYLVIRSSDDVKSIHISEINTIMVDTMMASITSYLMSELIKNKIKIIFCDETRDPLAELVPYYGSHNTSKRINSQIKWLENTKGEVWALIVKQKITNQAWLLKKTNSPNDDLLLEYINNIEFDDITNREGHAAKVYFYSLFGSNFRRSKSNEINAALNYGYTIILSTINREIVNNGYLTQLGIKHKNEFNNFNLSSDLIEPFRVIVDEYVFYNQDLPFDKNYKLNLVNLLNKKFFYNTKEYFLLDIIRMYVKDVLQAVSDNNISMVREFNLNEGKIYEDNNIL